MDIAQVRARVAVLFQDFVRYYLSARENITMGRWERADDDAAVTQAAVPLGRRPGPRGPSPAATTPISAPSSSGAATSPGANGSGWPWPGPSSATPS